MSRPITLHTLLGAALVLAVALLTLPSPAVAHCDTLDGPVVEAARQALADGEVTPVLKWVSPEHAPEVEKAFARTLAVRDLSPEAARLADRWFFETLVRLHREGEGFPFTGLKGAGTEIDPAVIQVDAGLEGDAEAALSALITHLRDDVEAGLRRRFAHAREAYAHREESVEAGRRFVAAYVELTHYAEALHQLAGGEAPLHGGGEGHDGHGGP